MTGMKIGYARVSSTGQSLEIQIDKLTAYGCTEIFTEKQSGTSIANREELELCMKFVRRGDTLVITKLDRLARSMVDLMNIKSVLKDKGASLEIIDQPALNDSSITGDLMFNILGAIAEFETGIRKERQTEGIAKAKSHGVKFGAKAKLTAAQLESMKIERASGALVKDLMTKYNISKATFYRLTSES